MKFHYFFIISQSWKSMPNLAKDMATQTTISSESSASDTDSDSEAEQPTSKPNLLPLEERKKAFLVQDSEIQKPLKDHWKSMPSLNKNPAPLPLVGACYPESKDEIQANINQIKAVFEPKFLAPPPTILSERKRSNSLSSVSSLSPASSTNESVIMEPSYLIKDPVVYRWDDESNGEIYTDKPISKEETIVESNESSLGKLKNCVK